MRPHILDDAIDPRLVLAAFASWPSAIDQRWHKYQTPAQNKYGTRDANGVTPAAMECIREIVRMAPEPWVHNAFPDWNLDGAGMHMIPPGGWLGKHLDSDHHPITGWSRRYSAVLCCNQEWQRDWGGEFIFNDGKDISIAQPRSNRLIIFQTTDTSWHEVTKVIGPESRKTVSVFFWSLESCERKRSQAEFVT